MVVRTKLITIDDRVLSPEGVVFSTDPRRAEAENEVPYFIKGPDLATVFAEISGCMLAREAGLPIPDVAACEFEGDVYAGSARVDDAVRDVEPWLNRPQQIRNFDDLFSTLVVDVWLANKDRNIGNVLGRPWRGAKVEFVFIDFEKSIALHPSPTVSSTMLEPRALWPSGILGRELRARRPPVPAHADDCQNPFPCNRKVRRDHP
jgi:hypothetical protein